MVIIHVCIGQIMSVTPPFQFYIEMFQTATNQELNILNKFTLSAHYLRYLRTISHFLCKWRSLDKYFQLLVVTCVAINWSYNANWTTKKKLRSLNATSPHTNICTYVSWYWKINLHKKYICCRTQAECVLSETLERLWFIE